MTRKKGNRNAKVQADTGSKAGVKTAVPAAAAPENGAGSAGDVASGDPAGNAGAAPADGADNGTVDVSGETLAVGADGAPGGNDGKALSDGEGQSHESGVAPGQAPETVAAGDDAAAGNSAGDNNGDRSADGAGAVNSSAAEGTAGGTAAGDAAGTDTGDTGAVGGFESSADAAGGSSDEGGVDGEPDGTGGPAGDGGSIGQDLGEGGIAATGGGASPAVEGAEDPIEPTPEDFNLHCAGTVLGIVLEAAADVVLLLDRDRWETLNPHALERGDIVAELGSFTRQIKENATPAVLAQQLLIKRLRPSAELDDIEAIAMKIFSTTLLELDRFADRERKRLEDAKPKPEPVPVPIEETTLEAVDGPMDTI